MNGQYSTDANLRGRFIGAHIVFHAMSVGSFYKFLPLFFVNLGGRRYNCVKACLVISCWLRYLRSWVLCLACRRDINKGIGVDNMHYLNDGLWKVCHCKMFTLSIAMTKIAALLLRNALIKIAASLMHCHAKAFLITFGCPSYNVLWALAVFNLSPCFADGTSRLRILKTNCDNIKKKWSIYIMVSSMWCGFSCLKESYVYPIFIYLFCLCMWSDHL